ncbi:MAG: cysteine hydrolase family protein [Gaiellaceae bacterium]
MSEPAELDETQGLQSWQFICQIPEFSLDYETSALVIIDLVYQQASRHHGTFKRLAEAGLTDDSTYAIDRIENMVVPNTARLIDTFREHGAPIIYTRCVSLRGDGSDQTRRHQAFGLVCSADSHDAQILDELAPQPGDIMLDKTGSSFFNSTNAEHLLHNMGVRTLVLTGIWTNSCVEGATRDGGDRDFDVALVEDACAAMSPRGHNNALEYLDKNFCHVWSTSEVIARLGRA